MSQDNIQYALYNEVMKRSEMIDELGESPEITQQRETTKKTLDVLRKAQMTIRRDPDFEGRIGEEKKSEWFMNEWSGMMHCGCREGLFEAMYAIETDILIIGWVELNGYRGPAQSSLAT